MEYFVNQRILLFQKSKRLFVLEKMHQHIGTHDRDIFLFQDPAHFLPIGKHHFNLLTVLLGLCTDLAACISIYRCIVSISTCRLVPSRIARSVSQCPSARKGKEPEKDRLISSKIIIILRKEGLFYPVHFLNDK